MAGERRERRADRAALAIAGMVILATGLVVGVAALLIGLWVWLH
jgi:hypothetical protein